MTIQLGGKNISKGVLNGKNLQEVWFEGKKVRPIGCHPIGWQPGPDTVAYYPLKIDANDYSGNNKDILPKNIDFSTGYADFDGSTSWGQMPSIVEYKTISIWFNAHVFNFMIISSKYNNGYLFKILEREIFNQNLKLNSWGFAINPLLPNTRYHVLFSQETNSIKFYLNGVKVDEKSYSHFKWTLGYLGYGKYWNRYRLNGKLSELIIESRPRTQDEVQQYFNSTKSAYGL